MTTIGFIGTGNMTTAMLAGMRSMPDLGEFRIVLYDVDREKALALARDTAEVAESIGALTSASDLIFLAVKPQDITAVLGEIAPQYTSQKTIVSIAAGIGAETIRAAAGESARVVLAMPNTPMLLGRGAIALAAPEDPADGHFALVRRIFGSCGHTEIIPADKMCEIIPYGGSAPAFIYRYALEFAATAPSYGIDPGAALRLFCHSLIGSAEMMLRGDDTPQELIARVSSKGGTTVAGLSAMDERDLKGLVGETVARCVDRARELSGAPALGMASKKS